METKTSSCPELTKLVSKPEFLKIIECPVCQQVPFPPIYQCTMGHNICKLCKPRLGECPLCKSGFSKARNYSVEQMVLASTHNCAYRDDGCQLVGTGELLCNHIKVCQFRSFTCPGKRNDNGCVETVSIKSSLVRTHFCDKHDVHFSAEMSRSFRLRFTSTTGDHSKVKNVAWSPTIIVRYGKDFLCQIYTWRDHFYWTIFLIGTAEEARKFNAKIIFYSEKDQSLRLQWKIPVQPIVKCEELRDGNEMKDILIPSCTFNDFKKVASRDDTKLKYLFDTEYKISKRE